MLLLMLIPSHIFAQEELERRIKVLEEINEELIRRQISIDKSQYETQRKNLEIAITLGSTLSVKWNAIVNNFSVSQGLNRITEINSIGKDNALGFDFQKVVNELVAKNLTVEFDKLNEPKEVIEQLKNRWKENVDKTINNPIIQGLVKSNPLTSIASLLISSAINFTDNKIKTSANIELISKGELPQKYKDFVTTWKDQIRIEAKSINSVGFTTNLISQNAIENFSYNIKPYTELFDQMSNSNLRFALKLEEASTMHSSFNDIIRNYDKNLMEYLKITKISDAPSRINELLKVDETERLPKYREAIGRDDLRDALILANQYSLLKDKVNELTENYYQIHIDYFEEYIRHLDVALSSTAAGRTKFDTEKILKTKEYLNEKVIDCKKAKSDLIKNE